MRDEPLLAWLVQARTPGGDPVRERFQLSTASWINTIRPAGNVETMRAFLLKWKRSGESVWFDRAQAIWDAISYLQNADGSWPFSTTLADKWTNDNSEVAIFLLGCADLDADRTATYRASALSTVGYLLSVQRADGAWQNGYVPGSAYAPMWAGHAIAALATAYPHADASTQADIVTAVENGVAWMATMVGGDGRVTTTYEVQGAQEAWRPPSSDQAICIRGLALAEQLVPSEQASSWAALRSTLRGWLDPLVDASGAIKNGYGVGVNPADVPRITDNVYTNPFAAAAYRECFAADGVAADNVKADGVLNFMISTSQWIDANPDANGCIRGAYDLVAHDFDTSEVAQNEGEEGGGDMAYTGWTAAPVAVLLMDERRRSPTLAGTM